MQVGDDVETGVEQREPVDSRIGRPRGRKAEERQEMRQVGHGQHRREELEGQFHDFRSETVRFRRCGSVARRRFALRRFSGVADLIGVRLSASINSQISLINN